MSVIGILALAMLAAAATILVPWTIRTRSGPTVRAAVLAAVVSSATVGVWGVLAEAFLGGATRQGVAGFVSYLVFVTIFYFELTIVQNVLGLTILANLRLRRSPGLLRRLTQTRGTFVPLGVLYGEAVLVVSMFGWVALFTLLLRTVDVWRYLPSLLFAGRLPLVLHTMAVAGGVTAVGILTLLAPRLWDQGPAGI